ncbi:YggN family protein [Vibrio tapetis subsp. quintayensis]|uniref:YggN family protein n=1 Tax=Vibrio tapetis TaxID=52443 RepID=UPI0025B32FD0|nr:YggN family protein [Vibrio tapetis]MDN3681374.1 YggN family protein [Vibrio tapetis subsp. quintayensis]
MKRSWLALGLLLSSQGVLAGQCKIDVGNEVHLDGAQVEVYQQGQPKVLIDKDNNVFINGEALDLDQMQQQAAQAYREKMNKYVPKAKTIANSGVELAKEIVDDVSSSFDNSEAFDNVKVAIDKFYADIEARYTQDGSFVLKEEAFSDAWNNWRSEFDQMRETFDSEFFSSAFTALSEKMKTEGGINLTELKDKMTELKNQLEAKVKGRSEDIKQDAEQYCDELEAVAEEEKALHEKIPELKNYRVFTI